MKSLWIGYLLIAQGLGTWAILELVLNMIINKGPKYGKLKMLTVLHPVYLYVGTHNKDSQLVSKRFRHMEFIRVWWRLCILKGI